MRTVVTPSRIERSELEDVVDFWTRTDADERLRVSDVREYLAEIQAVFERTAFESEWQDYPDAFDSIGFEVRHDEKTVLLVCDATGDGWKHVFESLSLTDDTTRKILRLVHARLGRRLLREDVDLDVAVVEKPEWLHVARRIERRTSTRQVP